MTTTYAIKSDLASAASLFHDQLAMWFRESVAPRVPAPLAAAMEHSLLAGGKRLRPVLVWWSCEACGGDARQAQSAAIAIECIHTFSLIHDDLPALDDDDLRRGRPTCHKAFGESTAILAGDALHTLAFEVIAKSKLKDSVKSALIAELAESTGPAGMIGGEWLDLDAEGKSLDEDDVQRIHTLKTAYLIRCACRMGGIVAEANKKQLLGLSGYGKSIGLAFQIADDLLDHSGDPEQMGKRTKKDDAKGKPTYPTAIGLEASRERMFQLVSAAEEHLGVFGEAGLRLRAIARYVSDRTT